MQSLLNMYACGKGRLRNRNCLLIPLAGFNYDKHLSVKRFKQGLFYPPPEQIMKPPISLSSVVNINHQYIDMLENSGIGGI
jgi:hypothetical protein